MGKRTAVWVEISCDNCGDLFEKKQSKLKYSKKHYCSLDCCDKHKKKTMKGKNNHRYGTKASKETNEKRSKSMKEQWKNQNYIATYEYPLNNNLKRDTQLRTRGFWVRRSVRT